jgi:hypothetical protein
MYLELVIYSDRVIRSAGNLQKILLSRYETHSSVQNWRQIKGRAILSWIQCCESRSDRVLRFLVVRIRISDPVSPFPVRFRHGITGSTTF